MAMALVNNRTERPLATSVELAETRAERRRGLLGRDRMDTSSALLLTPCFAVHTAFMRFSIDVIFVDRDGSVVKLVPQMEPWRMAIAFRACSVVELAAGMLERHAVAIGDRLYLSPTFGARGSESSSDGDGRAPDMRRPGLLRLLRRPRSSGAPAAV